MSSRTASQDPRSTRDAQRRKRKERSAKSPVPEPKDIVGGAGQPLDPSVRRELEERLGHDLGRVRLHIDRDAAALTDMLGADAVAVGQDVFFREGAYRPHTADGMRLLAHELLHTVQNPEGLGALRVGRDLGAVSLPQQAVEREAETAAQESAREGEPAAAAERVEEGRATPGWLRYATVDADRRRLELVDPATLTDRLANGVLRSLRGDPEDRSKRVRTHLARFSDRMREAVLDRLEPRLLSSEFDRLIELVEEVEESGLPEPGALDAPEAVPDVTERPADEREDERPRDDRRTDEEQRGEERPPREEEAAPEPPDRRQDRENGGAARPGARRPAGGPGRPAADTRTSEPSGGRDTAAGGGAARPRQTPPSAQSGQQARNGTGDRAESPDVGGAPAASKEESAAKNRPGAVEPLVTGQRPEQADKRGKDDDKRAGVEPGPLLRTADPGGRSTLAEKRPQDEAALAEDEPIGPESGPDGELGALDGVEDERAADRDSAWNIELKPEDFLPGTDLDVSGVPTADEIVPGSAPGRRMPSFPEPPVTKAEQVQARRDQEDEEEAASEDGEPAESAPADGAASDSPAARTEAENRTPRDLRTGTSVEQEVGSRPSSSDTAADRVDAPEPEPAAGDGARREERQAAPEEAAESTPENAPEDTATDRAADREPETAGTGTSEGRAPASGASGPSGTAPADTAPASPSPAPSADTSGPSRQPGGDTDTAGPGPATDIPAEASPARDTHVSGAGSRNDSTAGSGPEGGTGSRQRQGEPASAPAPRPASAPTPSSGSRPSRSVKGGGGTRSASGSGGGGGGARPAASSPPKNEPPAPNLSQVTPEAGLSTAARLKPHRALEALGGVNGAVDRTVGDEHRTLQDAPPTMERPAGAPQTLHGAPKTSAPGRYSGDPAAQVDAPEKEKAEVTGDKAPEGEIPGENIEEPGTLQGLLAGGAQLVVGAINGVADFLGADEDVIDSEAVTRWILDLPTEDEMLAQANVGTAPGVGLQGETNGRADEQGGELDGKGRELHASGRDDAGRPLGEDQIYPDVPGETLKAKVPGAKGQGGPGGGGAPSVGGRIPPEAVSAVAEHERGPQIQAAFADGQKQMSDKRQAKDRDFRESQERHRQQVRGEVESNTRTQAAERRKTKAEVEASREQWRKEQDDELDSLGTKKTEKIEKIRKDVKDKEEQTDKDAEEHRKKKQEDIGKEKDKAENDARQKRDTAKNDSGNWLTKAFNWIRDKLIELKNAIVGFFRAAREAVTSLIRDFKGTVIRWIEAARQFIIDKFKEFTEALIQLGRAFLDAIVEIAGRLRALIIRIRDAAIALVNRLADELKRIVGELLDRIGKILSGILDALREGLRRAVEAVKGLLKGIMDFAMGLLNALGEWAMIAADILSDPGGWLSGAKASAEDGAKNHLFREVTSAIKNWFNEKIQEILGLPKAIFDKLVSGGVSREQMAKEAWDAALPQLPIIIGEIVVTKIIAKLIPGAGWVMAIIDALKAAWGALSEILRAFGAFMDYLKAVKGGNAGVLFAKAVASGVVALLELAYQALLSGIGKYVSKVGDRLKGLAANLGKKSGPRDESPRNERKPQPTDRPRDDRGDRPDKREETEKARQQVRRANAAMSRRPRAARPPRPSRPQPRPTRRRAPAAPQPRRDTRGPETRRPDDRTRTDQPDRRTQDADRDQARTPARRETEGTRPTSRPRRTSPESRAANRARQTVKAAQNRIRRAKRALDRKDRDGRLDRSLDNNARRMRDAYRRRRDLLRDQQKRRQEQKRQLRDQRRKKEQSTYAKNDRLDEVIPRIRRILKSRLEPGIEEGAHLRLLSGLRNWYRLTDLEKEGGEEFEIYATLNPRRSVIRGVNQAVRDYLKFHKLPVPVVDPFPLNGVRPAVVTRAMYINKKYAEEYGRKPSNQYTEGWDYLTQNKMVPGVPQWDRMHLIPREVGGAAKTSNFVPALNSVNAPFYHEIEKHAANAFGQNSTDNPPALGWYTVRLKRYKGASSITYPHGNTYPEGFPEHLNAEWGMYRRKGNGGTGEKHSDWIKGPAVMSRSLNFAPPPPPSFVGPLAAPVRINVASRADVRDALDRAGVSYVNAVMKLRPFKDFDDMKRKMAGFRTKAGKPLNSFEATMRRLRQRALYGYFVF
ncbi:eCIS core domain-containing protein [Streptomyces macrosporus]|uniref:eCIS core domain-containing protein n=1 Tax=Streptomyces macrosporus TaxID=44032 RepID=A0ABP5WN49_9ACTN